MASQMPPRRPGRLLDNLFGPAGLDVPVACRLFTGAPAVDWRAMFAKYAGIVEACEGITFLYPPGAATPGAEDWTPGEWAAITALPGMERPV